MLTIDGLPVYFATLSGEAGALEAVSLVDSPAVLTGWQAFADSWKKAGNVPMAFADKERRIVRGVVMRAGFPILRDGYWLVFTEEAVRDIARRWLADGRGIGFDLMHDGRAVDGVEAVQVFIKDRGAGIDPRGFESVEDGSLFCELHVSDDGAWERVKSGELRGFSIAGKFDFLNIEDRTKMDKQTFAERLWRALFGDEEQPVTPAPVSEDGGDEAVNQMPAPTAPTEGEGWRVVFEGGEWKRYTLDEDGNPTGDGVSVKAVFVPTDFDEQALFGDGGDEAEEPRTEQEESPEGGQEPQAFSAAEVARQRRGTRPRMSELSAFVEMAKKVKCS